MRSWQVLPGRRFGGDDVSEYEKTSSVADHPAVFGNGGIFGCRNFRDGRCSDPDCDVFPVIDLRYGRKCGTQSLAVTIRVLMDENLNRKDKFGLILKEMRIGFANGLFLGIMAFVFIGLYVCFIKGNALSYSFLISGCVGVSLMLAMVISSLVGTTIPLLFHKIKVDPAVASGPLITTVNDLVAVVTYYVWSGCL